MGRPARGALMVLAGIGVWLVLTPWVLGDGPGMGVAPVWTGPVVGTVVTATAVARLLRPGMLRWAGPFQASLGIAILLVPTVLSAGWTTAAMLTSDIVCGVAIFGLSLLTLPTVDGEAASRGDRHGIHRR